jgi:hypothetical protein
MSADEKSSLINGFILSHCVEDKINGLSSMSQLIEKEVLMAFPSTLNIQFLVVTFEKFVKSTAIGIFED